MLSAEQQTKLTDLQRQLTAVSKKPEDTTSVVSVSLSTKDQIKSDLDYLIASECLYCGEFMIEYVLFIKNIYYTYYTKINNLKKLQIDR